MNRRAILMALRRVSGKPSPAREVMGKLAKSSEKARAQGWSDWLGSNVDAIKKSRGPRSVVDAEFDPPRRTSMAADNRSLRKIKQLEGELADHDEWFRSLKEARAAGEDVSDVYGGAYARRREAQAEARYKLNKMKRMGS